MADWELCTAHAIQTVLRVYRNQPHSVTLLGPVRPSSRRQISINVNYWCHNTISWLDTHDLNKTIDRPPVNQPAPFRTTQYSTLTYRAHTHPTVTMHSTSKYITECPTILAARKTAECAFRPACRQRQRRDPRDVHWHQPSLQGPSWHVELRNKLVWGGGSKLLRRMCCDYRQHCDSAAW